MNICQSCAMPMNSESMFGINTDGTLNKEYCIHCYPNGNFNNPSETLEEMVASCIPFMMQEGFTEEKARQYLTDQLTHLKRWSNK